MRIVFILSICLLGLPLQAQSPEQLLDQGVAEFEKGNYKKALSLFTRGAKAEKGEWHYLHRLWAGNCYYELLDYKKATEEFRFCLSIKPEYPTSTGIIGLSHWALGRIYGKQGKKNEELKAYYQALEYLPDDTYLLNNLGLCGIELGQDEKGIAVLTRALELQPENPYALNNRALGYIHLGQWDKALADLDRSKAILPDNPYLYKHYALYYIGTDNLDKACAFLLIAEEKGYEEYGNELDKFEVRNLKEQYCGEK